MIETPGIDEIFDLYVCYGISECLFRRCFDDFDIIPLGKKYLIKLNSEIRDVEIKIKNGLVDALEETLALHEAFIIENFESELDFSRGANINPEYYSRIPKILEKIRECLLNNRKQIDKDITIPITLMPSAGKFIPDHFCVKGGNPIKINKRDYIYYALAWVGFFFYTPYVKYIKEDGTFVHIYALIPLEKLNSLEVLALKDLKKRFPHYWVEDFMSNSKLALLYHLAHTESLGALEVLTKKSFSLRTYTLIKEGNRQAIRYFDSQNIGKLMNFLWFLKRRDIYRAIKFVDDLLKIDCEAGLSLVDAVLFDEVDNFYKALRIAKRSKISIPKEVIEGIHEYINNII